MALSAYEKFISDPDHRRLLDQERFIVEATECLARVMESQEVSKTDLAERLGKSKAFVTQVLNGSRNMTLKTFADFLSVLGYTARIVERPVFAARYDISSTSFISKRTRVPLSYRVESGYSPTYYQVREDRPKITVYSGSTK